MIKVLTICAILVLVAVKDTAALSELQMTFCNDGYTQEVDNKWSECMKKEYVSRNKSPFQMLKFILHIFRRAA